MTQEERLQILMSLKRRLSERDRKRLPLELFGRCLARMDSFQEHCQACDDFLNRTTSLLSRADQTPQGLTGPMKEEFEHLHEEGLSHLQKEHHMVQEGMHLSLCLALGLMLGGSLGLMRGQMPLGMSLGLSLGISIGVLLDAKAKRDGRVI